MPFSGAATLGDYLVPRLATVALSVSGVAGLAIRTGGCELEHRVAARFGGEGLDRGVLGRLEVRPRGGGEADTSLQDGRGLVGGDFPDGVVTGVTAAGRTLPLRTAMA